MKDAYTQVTFLIIAKYVLQRWLQFTIIFFATFICLNQREGFLLFNWISSSLTYHTTSTAQGACLPSVPQKENSQVWSHILEAHQALFSRPC